MGGDDGELSESAVRAARELRVGVSRLRRRLRDTQDRDELTASQTSVLSRLDRDGPGSVSELAVVEGVKHQSVTMSVAVLAERGLVERTPDPNDGRRQVISLSATGREYVAGRRAVSERWLARILEDRLTEDERRTVLTAMELLERVSDK